MEEEMKKLMEQHESESIETSEVEVMPFEGFPPKPHEHPISDVIDLQEELDNRSVVGHTHSVSEVNGLQDHIDSLGRPTRPGDAFSANIGAFRFAVANSTLNALAASSNVTTHIGGGDFTTRFANRPMGMISLICDAGVTSNGPHATFRLLNDRRYEWRVHRNGFRGQITVLMSFIGPRA